MSSPLPPSENTTFLNSSEARILRIGSEFIHPSVVLQKYKIDNTIVFFGSARTSQESEFSVKARTLAKQIANWARTFDSAKVVVCSGAGPGIMEAANAGATSANEPTLGLGIALPFEQANNPYVTPDLSLRFKYFFMRKFWLAAPAIGFIAFPGGFGTMDELFEMLTLMQTGKMRQIPIVLFGKSFWAKAINFEFLVEQGYIKREDLALFTITDDLDEAFRLLTENASKLARNRHNGARVLDPIQMEHGTKLL